MGQGLRGRREEREVFVIGLTGSIGAGKSTALAMFGECGASVFSADSLVHELYQRPEVAEQVVERFGPVVLDPAGRVDRSRLAEAVRGSPEGLRYLEGLTHPLVAQEIASRVEGVSHGGVMVFEVPLLFEAGYEHLFDLIVTVEAEPGLRRERSTHQFDLDLFTEFEALQASRERRTSGSDAVLVNDGGLEELRVSVGAVYATALAAIGGGTGEETG